MTQGRSSKEQFEEMKKLAELDRDLVDVLCPVDEIVAQEQETNGDEPRLKIPYVNATPISGFQWS